jgi:hypothetical protein
VFRVRDCLLNSTSKHLSDSFTTFHSLLILDPQCHVPVACFLLVNVVVFIIKCQGSNLYNVRFLSSSVDC